MVLYSTGLEHTEVCSSTAAAAEPVPVPVFLFPVSCFLFSVPASFLILILMVWD
jgi:hypothetical protein